MNGSAGIIQSKTSSDVKIKRSGPYLIGCILVNFYNAFDTGWQIVEGTVWSGIR